MSEKTREGCLSISMEVNEKYESRMFTGMQYRRMLK